MTQIRTFHSPLITILCLLWFHHTAHSHETQYNLSASAVLDGSNNFNLSLSIVPTKGILSIHITGPDSKWFGVGFGNTIMTDTYAIVCSKDTSSASVCQENKLGSPGSTGYGQQLSQTIHVLHDTTSNHIRKVHIMRNISINNANYFAFPTSATQSINIIFAIGNTDSFTSSTTTMGSGGSTSLHVQNSLTNNLTVHTTPCGAKIIINSIIVHLDQDLVQLNMTGPDDRWFGIGFNSSAMGPTTYAIVCDSTTCHENYITGHGYGTSLTSTIQMVHSESINGQKTVLIHRKMNISASDTTDFAQYFDFPVHASTLPIIYAIGQNNAWSSSSPMNFSQSTFGTTAIVFDNRHNTSNGTLCQPGVAYYGTQADVGNGFTVGLYIYCKAQTIRLSIDYTDYAPNWFGVVFNSHMVPSPNATVFTTGKKDETQRPLALHAYDLGAKQISAVVYHEERNWKKIEQTVIHRKVSLVYEQPLQHTKWNIFTKRIDFRYAWGSAEQGTVLQQHGPTSTSKLWTFNLATGHVSASGWNTLQTVHGIIMFVSWSVLATIGIFSSRFRGILCQNATHKAMWFFVHRGVQSSVVLLVLVGVSIAVYFTCDDGETHFSNRHEHFGLGVVIVAVLQPINAWFRPHPPGKHESKSCGRFVWESVHKIFGYCAWIVAQYTIYLGIGRLTTDTLYRTVFLGWVGGVVAVFLILGFWNAFCGTSLKESTKPLLSNVAVLGDANPSERNSL
eukprot:267379_1